LNRPRDPADAPAPRRIAFDILLRVETAGAYASVLLERSAAEAKDPRDVRLNHRIVLGVLQTRGALDAAIESVASRPIARMDPPVRVALRMGAYALFHLDRVPEFAAVDSAVELVKRTKSHGSAGFVNGVLRRLARGGPELLPRPPDPGDAAGLATWGSHPEWWVRRVVERLGFDEAARLLAANNEPAATVLRPNLCRLDAAGLRERLGAEGVSTEPCRFVPEASRVLGGSIERASVLREGLAWVQDEAAQLVPLLFGGATGRSLDLCAAPGGKSFQLSETLPPGAPLVAVDRHPGRLRRMARLLRLLDRPDVLLVAADLSRPAPPVRGAFDRVLLDAPCSGTGTLRRHPEIRWRLSADDVARLAGRQRVLLDRAAALVAPRGTLVYSVCSLEPEEGERQVERFLRDHPAFAPEDAAERLPGSCRELVRDTGFLHTSPVAGGLDGFFAAVLCRRE
jgi:16S rRNA (cytosine967-C5)-methyltransferase